MANADMYAKSSLTKDSLLDQLQTTPFKHLELEWSIHSPHIAYI